MGTVTHSYWFFVPLQDIWRVILQHTLKFLKMFIESDPIFQFYYCVLRKYGEEMSNDLAIGWFLAAFYIIVKIRHNSIANPWKDLLCIRHFLSIVCILTHLILPTTYE